MIVSISNNPATEILQQACPDLLQYSCSLLAMTGAIVQNITDTKNILESSKWSNS
ncbi:MAG: hypothetical protein ACKVOF_08990 [Pseudohongiellaceae bacterium]